MGYWGLLLMNYIDYFAYDSLVRNKKNSRILTKNPNNIFVGTCVLEGNYKLFKAPKVPDAILSFGDFRNEIPGELWSIDEITMKAIEELKEKGPGAHKSIFSVKCNDDLYDRVFTMFSRLPHNMTPPYSKYYPGLKLL